MTKILELSITIMKGHKSARTYHNTIVILNIIQTPRKHAIQNDLRRFSSFT